MPTKVSDTEYVRSELELWQSGVLTGALLGFLLGALITGLVVYVAASLI